MKKRVRRIKQSESIEGLFISEMINMYILWTMITFSQDIFYDFMQL